MKRCPTCKRLETDDALVFCRVDGTALVNESSPLGNESGTTPLASASAATEIETSILPHTTDVGIVRSTGPTTMLPAPQAEATSSPPKPRRRLWIAAGVIVVVSAIAISGYFIFGKRQRAIESVAVLPFENKSGNTDFEYLSDGFAESLIYRLSQLSNLKVSPRSSVFRYKGQAIDAEKIGAELGVDAVMSGRMVQHGDSLTISVDLIDVRNKKTLWGEQYERKMSDVLATQREIAATITEKLQVKLSGNDAKSVAKQYTNSNEAYQAYLKGRFFWNKRDGENLRKAIEQFRSASEIDANFALAYVGLADCYGVAAYYDSTLAGTETLLKAKAYAIRSLEIDDSLSEAHASLANVNTGLWNWAEAEEGYKRAIALNPNYSSAHQWYGNQLTIFSRFDEAIAEIKRAQALEPLSPIINLNLAELYMLKGDLPASLEQNQRTFDLDPNWYFVRQSRAMLYLIQGRNADAETEAEKSVEMSARETFPLGVLGFIYARNGRRAEAQAILDELKKLYELRKANGHDLARICLGLGDKDQVFAWLEKDFQARSSTMPSWLANPPFDSLHDDPRYKELAKRMGLLR